MTRRAFNVFALGLMDGSIDPDTDDLRIALLMTNTTVLSDAEAIPINNLASFGTLDEFDGGAPYARQSLAGKTPNRVNATPAVGLTVSDVAFGNLVAGTRSIKGALIYKHVDGTAANDIPLFYADFDTVKTPDGSAFTVQYPSGAVDFLPKTV
jgi:hypothetical protein